MQIQVVSKGIDVSAALRARIQERMDEVTAKLSRRPGEATVVIEREGFGFRVDCSLHLPTGAVLQSRAADGDAYAAAESALDRMVTRLRRYKQRLTARRWRAESNVYSDGESVAQVVLERSDLTADGEEKAGVAGEASIVIAETSTEVPVLTVGMAVHDLELAKAPALMFRNAAHGALNVVFRRPDGHIGWIDPGRSQSRSATAP
jgi:ribosomal subunit interface protein